MKSIPLGSAKFVVCLQNEGYEVSLEVRKIYQLLPDSDAAAHQMLRVIDESGEDYLFPQNMFEPIDPPERVVEIFKQAA
ncbi:MAG TPA: hypothetical protein VGI75_07945 [Pirellulales bacterium]|jgi:hypothetical protein